MILFHLQWLLVLLRLMLYELLLLLLLLIKDHLLTNRFKYVTVFTCAIRKCLNYQNLLTIHKKGEMLKVN